MNRITQRPPPDELFSADELDVENFDGSNLDLANLTCHQIRHYDSGQWLSEEPIGHEGDDASVTPYVDR